jgi:hypothetical protein
MYELIIFTMMQPFVEPRWQYFDIKNESECMAEKARIEEAFSNIYVTDFIYVISCEAKE